MRIVLDTNVLIAAFITSGACSRLLDHCIQKHQLVTSDFILDELREHLHKKFSYSLQEVKEVVELLQSKMEVVLPTQLEVSVCRDPDDDIVLGTAIAGEVACIITGDKDLLVIKQFQMTDIIHPSEFAEYEAQRV